VGSGFEREVYGDSCSPIIVGSNQSEEDLGKLPHQVTSNYQQWHQSHLCLSLTPTIISLIKHVCSPIRIWIWLWGKWLCVILSNYAKFMLFGQNLYASKLEC